MARPRPDIQVVFQDEVPWGRTMAEWLAAENGAEALRGMQAALDDPLTIRYRIATVCNRRFRGGAHFYANMALGPRPVPGGTARAGFDAHLGWFDVDALVRARGYRRQLRLTANEAVKVVEQLRDPTLSGLGHSEYHDIQVGSVQGIIQAGQFVVDITQDVDLAKWYQVLDLGVRRNHPALVEMRVWKRRVGAWIPDLQVGGRVRTMMHRFGVPGRDLQDERRVLEWSCRSPEHEAIRRFLVSLDDLARNPVSWSLVALGHLERALVGVGIGDRGGMTREDVADALLRALKGTAAPPA